MKLRHAAAAAAGLALISAPVLAEASLERSTEPVEGEQLEGEGSIIIVLLAAAAVIAGILVLSDDDDDAVSP